MPSSSLSRRVLLLGYFDRGNVGDDLMRDALIEALPGLLPEARVATVRLPPFSRKGVLEARRLLVEVFRSDVVVLAGGSHFHDRLGARSVRVLALLAAVFALARASGARVGYAGVGVGPVGSRTARALVRGLLLLSHATLVRDERSARLARTLAPSYRVLAGLDLALLQAAPPVRAYRVERAGVTLGISLVPYFAEFEGAREADGAMLGAVAEALVRVAADHPLRVLLLPLFDPPARRERGDRLLLDALAARLRERRIEVEVSGSSVDQVRAAISNSDALLATRYHAVLTAYVAVRPVVMVEYDAKCRALADDIQLPEPARLRPAELLDANVVEARLRGLLGDPCLFSARLPVEKARGRAKRGLEEFIEALALDGAARTEP